MRHPQKDYLAMIAYGIALTEIIMNPEPFTTLAANVRRIWECERCHHQHAIGRRDLCGW